MWLSKSSILILSSALKFAWISVASSCPSSPNFLVSGDNRWAGAFGAKGLLRLVPPKLGLYFVGAGFWWLLFVNGPVASTILISWSCSTTLRFSSERALFSFILCSTSSVSIWTCSELLALWSKSLVPFSFFRLFRAPIISLWYHLWDVPCLYSGCFRIPFFSSPWWCLESLLHRFLLLHRYTPGHGYISISISLLLHNSLLYS